MTTSFLDVRGLSKRFGGLVACDDIRFGVSKGEIFGIIGPNGAGKTTLFNVIAGHFKSSAGSIIFDGRDITDHASDEIGRWGISRTFQAVHLFKEETVLENLRLASAISARHNPLVYFFARTGGTASKISDVANFLGVSALMKSVAGNLSYGQQKMLGVGMALMTSPKLLLMDEPAAGLNPSEKRTAADLIRRVRSELGISVLLVEHDMPLVMGVCDRILVVNQGRQIALGVPDQIKANPEVIEAYLGEEYDFA